MRSAGNKLGLLLRHWPTPSSAREKCVLAACQGLSLGLGSSLPIQTTSSTNFAIARGFQSSACTLQSANVIMNSLRGSAGDSAAVPYSTFLETCLSSGKSEEEAKSVYHQLEKSGEVIRVGNFVYLDPASISETVLKVLPRGEGDIRDKLQKMDEELLVLDERHRQFEQVASRSANRYLLAGLVILGTQLALFIWLTWWEFSWDVMEPFSYCIGLFYTLVAYTFFLASKGHVFDLKPFHAFWTSRVKQRMMNKNKFDERRYMYLTRMKGQYLKHLETLARQQ